MDITLTLVPDGNTTAREVASLTDEAAEALRGMRDVKQVSPVSRPAPDGAKGLAVELGSLLVSIAPTAVPGIFGVLNGLVARSPAATKVKMSADGGVELEFDPRKTTPEQMASMVNSIRAAHPG